MKCLVFAFPTKRLKVSYLFAKSLRNKEQYKILFLTRLQKEDHLKGYQLLSWEEVTRKFLEAQSHEEKLTKFLQSNSNKGEMTCRRILQVTKELINEKVRAFARLTSLGFLDSYDAALYKAKIERDSFVIETLIRAAIPQFDKSEINICFEGSRDHSFGLPILLLRKRLKNLRIFIVELADSADEKILSLYKRESYRGSLLNRFKRKNFKKFRSQAYKSKLFFTVPQHMAIRELDIEMEYPWINGTSQIVDLVFYRSEEILNKIAKMGLRRDNMRFIGEPMSDLMTQSSRHQLRKCISEIGATALIALPQALENPRDFRGCGRQDIEDMITALVNELSLKFRHLTISLHPKQSFGDYSHLIDGERVQISRDSIYTLMPKFDFFVCGSSSTFYLALLLKVPTLVFLPKADKTSKTWSQRIGDKPWFAKLSQIQQIKALNLENLKFNAQEYFDSEEYSRKLSVQLYKQPYSERFFQEINKSRKY